MALAPDLVLYLFGASAEQGDWRVWDQLARGAIGSILLVDIRDISSSFALIDFFEDRGLPYLVAMNGFDDSPHRPISDVRQALAIGESVPILACDARSPESAKQMLLALAEHVVNFVTGRCS